VKKTFLFLSTLAALATALVWLASPTQGDEKKTFPHMGKIDRIDPAFDKLIAPGAYLENLADGWGWAEGPIWIKDGAYLLNSDTQKNNIIKWKEGEGRSVFLHPSGTLGERTDLVEPGSNGLTLDRAGRLIMCQHGERRVARLEKDNKTETALADHYDGKRFNSPNDVVVKSNGDVYFTDPPYGLVKKGRKAGEPEFPGMEMDYSGVYRVSKDGKVTLLTKEMTRPNGIAFSPDEKTLYVSNSDPQKAVWMAFEVKDDGTLGKGRVFYDNTKEASDKTKLGLPDGMKVDKDGNLFATGAGGLFVFTPEAKLLGIIATGVATANCNWGDDGSTLYICADKNLTRIKTKTKGNGWDRK
jgi:gluconolactonase